MTGPPEPAPAEQLQGTLRQAISDLGDVARQVPLVRTEGQADDITRTLDRLSLELNQAAILVQEIPARP